MLAMDDFLLLALGAKGAEPLQVQEDNHRAAPTTRMIHLGMAF
jgi:hypothetical protein